MQHTLFGITGENMRWKLKPKPKIADTRVVSRFAFFPKIMLVIHENYTKHIIIWLEFYNEAQRYEVVNIEETKGTRIVNKWVHVKYCLIGQGYEKDNYNL